MISRMKGCRFTVRRYLGTSVGDKVHGTCLEVLGNQGTDTGDIALLVVGHVGSMAIGESRFGVLKPIV